MVCCYLSVLQFEQLSSIVARQRTTIADLRHQIHQQQKTIADLRRQIRQQHRIPAQVATSQFSVDSVNNSSIPGLFKFYTGFTFSIFLTIFSCLVTDETSVPFAYSRNIPSLNGLSLVNQ